MITMLSALTVLFGLGYIALSMQALKFFRSLSNATRVNRLERLARTFGLLCSLSFALTMIGHYLFGAWIQAIVATLSLAVALSYALYCFEKKIEVIITLETYNKTKRS